MLFEDKEEREIKARQRREDLMILLTMPHGFRFVYSFIESLGGGKCVANNDVDITMHNIAEQLLDDVAAAHPEAYLTMMGQLRGLNTGGKNG